TAPEVRLSRPRRLPPARERSPVLGRLMVGCCALVRIARDRLHDVFPAAPVDRTPGVRYSAPPRSEAVGGRPAGAAPRVAPLGTSSMAGGALLEVAGAAKAGSG